MISEKREVTEIDITENVLRGVQFYYTPMLVYLGSLGNCISVCVFFGTKLCRSSSSVYLGVLAISDTGFLISVFVVWLNLLGVDLFNQWGFCQFFIYLTTLCSFLSVWFVVAFTVERFIAVRYPLHRQSVCTVARAKITVAILSGLGVILCSPVLWLSAPRAQINRKGNVTECHLAEGWESWATAFNVIDTVLTFAIPFTVIAILNTLIARTMYKHAKLTRSLTTEAEDPPKRQSNTPYSRSSFAQTKITKMLLIISTVFLCFNLPAYVVRVHAFLHDDESTSRSAEMVQQVCNLLFNTNFGINFVLYCATGQNFRKAMCRMLLPRSRRRETTMGHVSNQGTQIVSEHGRSNGPRTQSDAIVLTELQVISN